MKARVLLGLCALLALPACFDPLVGTRCAKGYSRCGSQCVVAGTCAQVDASVDTEDREAGAADTRSERPDGFRAEILGADTSTDENPVADAEGIADEAGTPTDTPEIEAGIPEMDAGLDGLDGNVEDASSPPEIDAPVSGGGDAESFDLATDAPLPDTWSFFPDGSDVDSQDASTYPDGDAGVDAPSLETGGLAVDGVDANQEDGEVGESDANGDAESDLLGEEAGPLVCEGTLTACAGECVDTNSNPYNCHECGNSCPSGECISGVCLECAPGETVCHETKTCADTGSDPDNCGTCGTSCPSGICSSGNCEAAAIGRVIVIGHDYSNSNLDKNQILSNAVFLWRRLSTVQLLVYKEKTTEISIQGTNNALTPGPGQQVIETAGTLETVPSLLASTDVFLIYAQANATDLELNQLGTAWADSLWTFVKSGHTVIVLDGDQASNSGTVQILSTAGLFNLTRLASASASTVKCNIVASGDFLVAGTSNKTGYACRYFSTTFTVGVNLNEDGTPADITSVIEATVGDAGSAPVVVRRTF